LQLRAELTRPKHEEEEMANKKQTKKPKPASRAEYLREWRQRIANGHEPKKMLVRNGKLTPYAEGLSKTALRDEAQKRGNWEQVKQYV
jgi:hypothetical protein